MRYLLPVLLLLLVSCHSYGGGNVPDFRVGLDVRGATNSACTLVVAHGDTTLTFDVSAPATPLPDTSLSATRASPMRGCTLLGPDAGASRVVTGTATPDDGSFTLTRSATELCVEGSGHEMQLLGFDASSERDCPVTLHLVCGGAVLYDAAPGTVCQWEG